MIVAGPDDLIFLCKWRNTARDCHFTGGGNGGYLKRLCHAERMIDFAVRNVGAHVVAQDSQANSGVIEQLPYLIECALRRFGAPVPAPTSTFFDSSLLLRIEPRSEAEAGDRRSAGQPLPIVGHQLYFTQSNFQLVWNDVSWLTA